MQKNNSPRKWPFSKKKEICCPVCRAWVRHDEINVVLTVGGQGSSSGAKVEVSLCVCVFVCVCVCVCMSYI